MQETFKSGSRTAECTAKRLYSVTLSLIVPGHDRESSAHRRLSSCVFFLHCTQFNVPASDTTRGKQLVLYIKYQNQQGQIIKEIIEVKPKAQTKKPTKKGKHYGKYLREARTYAINRAKWEAAEEYCLDRGYKFRIITEDHLKA